MEELCDWLIPFAGCAYPNVATINAAATKTVNIFNVA
jgi:hypothetical protein